MFWPAVGAFTVKGVLQGGHVLARVGVDDARGVYAALQHLVHLGGTGAVEPAPGGLGQHAHHLAVRVALDRCRQDISDTHTCQDVCQLLSSEKRHTS